MLFAGCGPLEAEVTCPDSLESYCADNLCPSTPQRAAERACDHYQIYRDGDWTIVGRNSGHGAHLFHYSGNRLVGVSFFSDALGPDERGCSTWEDFGQTFDWFLLDTGEADTCLDFDAPSCVPACTFCPTFEEIVPRCADDVFDSAER